MTTQYLDLLRAIKERGVKKGDRTGTGTTSLFGHQIRFDLSEGFPLLTTKRVWWRGVVEELLWFLRGDTNVNTLSKDVQKWWTPWALEDGELGPIYGEQFRRSRWWGRVEPRIFDSPFVERVDGLFCGVGDVANVKATHCNDMIDDLLKPVWRDMIKRCYDENSKGYSSYGGRGVHMDPAWFLYPQFKADAQKLEGWPLKRLDPKGYSIDKDLFASNRYGPDTTLWLSRIEQGMNTSTNMPFTAVSPEGVEELFPSLGDAHRRFGLNLSAAHRCLRGKLHTHHGWNSFKYVEGPGVLRFREVDQLKSVLANILYNPNSRRNVINLWHTPAMGVARLPCCHGAIIQFWVAEGKLSCLMYQRSCDVFLGVPVNIASYALLTHMLAHVCGLGVGEFIHTFGDVHIYRNHEAQVTKQLRREPRPLPRLILDRSLQASDTPLETLLSIERKHMKLTDYKPHPKIKAEVSV